MFTCAGCNIEYTQDCVAVDRIYSSLIGNSAGWLNGDFDSNMILLNILDIHGYIRDYETPRQKTLV